MELSVRLANSAIVFRSWTVKETTVRLNAMFAMLAPGSSRQLEGSGGRGRGGPTAKDAVLMEEDLEWWRFLPPYTFNADRGTSSPS